MTDRDPSRVHWMELFFDLIFVALVGQLAHGLHSAPTFGTLLLFVALFATVWWSWVNLTFAVDVMPQLSRRTLALVMLVSMFGVGAIAVAAPEATTDRAGLFAAGNAVLRLVLLVLWVRQQWSNGLGSRLRVSAYNGLTAALWLASIAVPRPFDFALWSLAIVLEVVLLITSSSRWASRVLGRLNVEHLSERFGLLVIIVLGESVVSIVAALDAALTLAAVITAGLALVTVSLLAWSFFLYGADAMRAGLAKLRDEGNDRAIRDTVAFLPFLLVSGVTAISGALAIAITRPATTLPAASAVSLGGGIALFYFTNAIISRRFGIAWREVFRWAVPACGLPLILIVVALVASAQVAVILAVLILGYVLGSAELTSRRREAAAG
ncbi:MAG TPA: low temperature requirement protein A [Humibacter sp.]|nr:low temperature requirement protein A [Humibacter sp.]